MRHAAGWADGTQRAYLAAVEQLYRAAETTVGADRLDEILSSLDAETLQSVLERFFALLRNDQTASGRPRGETWTFPAPASAGTTGRTTTW